MLRASLNKTFPSFPQPSIPSGLSVVVLPTPNTYRYETNIFTGVITQKKNHCKNEIRDKDFAFHLVVLPSDPECFQDHK